MPVVRSRYIALICCAFTLFPGLLFAATDTPDNNDSKQYKSAAMLCLIQHDWYETAVIGRQANIPREHLMRIVDSRFGKPSLIGFKHASDYAIVYVYQYSPQTNIKYAELGDKLLDKCLNATHIMKYKKKITNCLQNAKVAGDIFSEKNKGARLADAEKKFQPLLAGDKIGANLVKEIYKTKDNVYAFRMNTFARCAKNIDVPAETKQAGSK